MKLLVIMRGLPGSGKSYTCRSLIGQLSPGTSYKVCSTDDFWGWPYQFDHSYLSEAHLWNYFNFVKAVFDDTKYIFIDNTNIKAKEFLNYIRFATSKGYNFTMVESDSPWRYDFAECYKRNTHDVPREVLERMISRWESNEYVLKTNKELEKYYVRSTEIFDQTQKL